jgi:hypothetical protein
MAGERREPERVRKIGDPNRPAYDNPVGNKGELAVGDNVRKPRRRRRSDMRRLGIRATKNCAARSSDRRCRREPTGFDLSSEARAASEVPACAGAA